MSPTPIPADPSVPLVVTNSMREVSKLIEEILKRQIDLTPDERKSVNEFFLSYFPGTSASIPQPPEQPSTEGKVMPDGTLRSTQRTDQPRTGVNAEVGAATEPPERPQQVIVQINPVPSATMAKGIAARAWCHEKNSEKPMDPDLAEAFAIEMICWNAEMRDNLFASLEAGAKVAAEELAVTFLILGPKKKPCPSVDDIKTIILRHLTPKETKG